MRLNKLSRQEPHGDMIADESAEWKHSNSLSSLSDAAHSVCLIKTLVLSGQGSPPHLSLFSFSLSLCVASCTPSSLSHSLTPSLSCVSTECHRVSIWGITDGSGILPLRRPAPHYSWQHRACLGVWEDPLQVLQVGSRASLFFLSHESRYWYQ